MQLLTLERFCSCLWHIFWLADLIWGMFQPANLFLPYCRFPPSRRTSSHTPTVKRTISRQFLWLCEDNLTFTFYWFNFDCNTLFDWFKKLDFLYNLHFLRHNQIKLINPFDVVFKLRIFQCHFNRQIKVRFTFNCRKL